MLRLIDRTLLGKRTRKLDSSYSPSRSGLWQASVTKTSNVFSQVHSLFTQAVLIKSITAMAITYHRQECPTALGF